MPEIKATVKPDAETTGFSKADMMYVVIVVEHDI